MAERLGSGVEVEAFPDRTRYVLPRRGGGGWRRILGALPLLGVAGWAGMGFLWELRKPYPGGCALIVGLLVALFVGILAAWLAWTGLRKRAGRSILEVRGDRVWFGEEWLGTRSGRSSEPGGTIQWIDVARLDRGREQILITFSSGPAIAVATGWPGPFLREFRSELRARHSAARPQPAPPPPPARPRVASPRPPGPDVRRPAPVRRPGETGIEFLSDPPAPVALGECQVCSTPMTGDVVACQRCRTPHHRTCWEYNGRCSTYGCGGTRSMAVGPVGKEEVLEIRGGGGKLKRRFLRDWMVQVAREQGLGHVRSREKKHRHCEASFRVDGLACDLVGRKQGDRLDFVILAVLSTAEARAAAETLPADTGAVRRQVVSGGRLELRPTGAVDSLARLQRFVSDSLGMLREVAEGRVPRTSG